MIFGFFFITINFFLGYKLLKYHILRDINDKNNNLILLGSFLVGSVICGSSLYALDILFVKLYNNYSLSLIFYSVISLILLILGVRKYPILNDIRYDINTFIKDKVRLIVSILFLLYSIWIYYGSLNIENGSITTDAGWGDSLYHLAYVNLISLKNNIPIEYPFFAGHPVHYHFMFDYLAGKFAFLGINPVHSLNLFSIIGLLTLLLLIYEFGAYYFNNKIIGVLGSFFLIFHSSMASLRWLVENFDINIISKVLNRGGVIY